MTTHVSSAHTIELPQRLIDGDPKDFLRVMVRIHALQTLARVYPCTSRSDSQITVETREESDAFQRTDIIGTASAPCGAPETCPATRKARP
ncbi:hypothetical protein [Streptomyces sp. MH60]|uniref:hypothetical protein n=1 Tax=Streptomyces sp. MH60 TaxID=1940758 RepID=UPI000CEE4D8B|nr:hypothetical protein [Streptomyces sp. MH60]PPS89510.1 hypothetical protein BZZ08_01656 [Streptomyces sp. MH60]